MKKRLLALFLTLGLVCTVLTACGDGSKGQGGQAHSPIPLLWALRKT